MDQQEKTTAMIGGLGILILFIPIPIITQVIGISLLLYAAYRYWGRDKEDNATTG